MEELSNPVDSSVLKSSVAKKKRKLKELVFSINNNFKDCDAKATHEVVSKFTQRIKKRKTFATDGLNRAVDVIVKMTTDSPSENSKKMVLVMTNLMHKVIDDVGDDTTKTIDASESALHAIVDLAETTIIGGDIGEASGKVVGDVGILTERFANTPMRLFGKIVSDSMDAYKETIPPDDGKASFLLKLMDATVEAINAVTESDDTPFTRATEAFKRKMMAEENKATPTNPGLSVEDQKNVADMMAHTESIAKLFMKNDPEAASKMLYQFMIQSILWTWQVNAVVKKYPDDIILGAAAEKLLEAVTKMHGAFEKAREEEDCTMKS